MIPKKMTNGGAFVADLNAYAEISVKVVGLLRVAPHSG